MPAITSPQLPLRQALAHHLLEAARDHVLEVRGNGRSILLVDKQKATVLAELDAADRQLKACAELRLLLQRANNEQSRVDFLSSLDAFLTRNPLRHVEL